MTPHAAVNAIERDPPLPSGPGDAFAGHGIIGLPFLSGHVLALRRFCASSLGPPYTSVWHRDPSGRWTFYSTVAPDCSCARYFGGQVDRNVVTPIDLSWPSPWALRVRIGMELRWQLTLRAAHRGMGLAADASFGTARLTLTGRTPNGHRLRMNPSRLWLIGASTARVCGHDLGPPGPLQEQAALEDVLIPQRGLFAIMSVHLDRPARGQATATEYGKPCSPTATTSGGCRREGRDDDQHDR